MATAPSRDALTLSNVADVERAILTLYRTTDAEQRSRVDKALIVLQRSPDGFQVADQLLQSQHNEVRFYGATTFIVKIHKDLDALEEGARHELLLRLMHWLVFATYHDYAAATIRKLCSALVAFFTETAGTWKSFVLDLQNALNDGYAKYRGSNLDAISAQNATSVAAEKTMLTFISILLQDVSENSEADPKVIPLEEAIADNVPRMVDIIQRPLQTLVVGSSVAITVKDAVDCYHSLVVWGRTAVHGSAVRSWNEDRMKDIKPLLPPIISLVGDPEVSRAASEFLYEVVDLFESFLGVEDYAHLSNVLRSEQAQKWLQEFLSGGFDDEPLWIAKLHIAYCEARIEDLASQSCDADRSVMLKQALMVMSCSGVAAAEDPVASPALEFWSNWVECVRETNEQHMREPQRWLTWNNGLMKDLLLCLTQRIKHPSVSQWRAFTPDEKKLFYYFRLDARDLLITLEAFFGMSMTTDLALSIIDSTQREDWLGVEGSLFCLNSLLSQVDYESKGIEQIARPLFRSDAGGISVFEKIKSSPTAVPTIVYREVINFFSATESLAQQDPSHLLLVLQCLAEWFSMQPLAMPAANVFLLLCRNSRKAVMETGTGDQLLGLLRTYAGMEKRDFAVQEMLAGAVAAVAQAYASNLRDDAISMLSELLQIVQNDVDECLTLPDVESAKALGACALRSLDRMGKAFRTPGTHSYRRPGTALYVLDDDTAAHSNFWSLHSQDMISAQTKILGQCTTVLERFNGSEEIFAVCHILRSGYTEDEPGPFVFSVDATTTLLRACHLSTPSIGEVFKNVSTLLQKYRSKQSAAQVFHFAQDCLQHVQSMIYPYFQNDPGRDPDVAALVIDFVKSYIPEHTNVLIIQSTQHPDYLEFFLTCLQSKEILPKQSAALFWARFVKDRPDSADDGYNAILNRHAEALTRILMQQVGGGASRSDLDYLIDPVKAIVYIGGPFRKYIRESVAALQIPETRVSATDKRVFAETLLNLRGRADTRNVVESFSAQCRGTLGLYTALS